MLIRLPHTRSIYFSTRSIGGGKFFIEWETHETAFTPPLPVLLQRTPEMEKEPQGRASGG